MEESVAGKVSISIHIVTGIVAGYVSLLVGTTLYALGAAALMLIATGYAVQPVVGKRGRKWWMSHGGIIYILVWIIAWIFFFNAV